MSDNMSTTKQAAATKTKSPTIDTVPSASEVAQPEVASQADSEATTIKDDTAVLTEGFHFKSTDSVDSSTTGAPDTPAAIADADVSPTKTSPKKRVAAKAADDESPKKKARAIKPKPITEVNPEDDQSKSPVKKGRAAKAKTPTTEPKVKSESECTSSTAVDEDAVSDAVPEPKTPKKGGRASKAKTPAEPKTPKTPKNTRAAKEPKSAERKRATPGKVADKVPLPTTWATASGADKMLVKMKEEGKSWNEIRETWQTMTGQETAGSTLPNR
ncbi:MAG: hypothetical protein Q9203_006025 [Teloschistes exilis]